LDGDLDVSRLYENGLTRFFLIFKPKSYVSPLQIQLNSVQKITGKLQPLQSSLQKIDDLDRQCEEANTEENDYTIYSVEDLSFELSLAQKAVQKKRAFIENQVVERGLG
jgi:hypothetical protein